MKESVQILFVLVLPGGGVHAVKGYRIFWRGAAQCTVSEFAVSLVVVFPAPTPHWSAIVYY